MKHAMHPGALSPRDAVPRDDAGAATPRRYWRHGTAAVSLALAAVAIPYRHYLLQSVGALTRLDPAWFLAAIGCEVVSVLAFALTRWRFLSAGGHRVGIGAVTAVTCAQAAG